MNEDAKPTEPEETESTERLIPWNTFLEEYPIGTRQDVSGYYTRGNWNGQPTATKASPTLRLFCRKCEGIRNFEGKWAIDYELRKNSSPDDFLVYTCKDCEEEKKHYSLLSWPKGEEGNGIAIKVGEYPDLNIKIPTSLPKLLGEDYPYFIKGLKCEKQGFGVAAYAYYRRVLENQKSRLLGEILKVSKKLGAKEDITDTIESAIAEVQFSKAIDTVKESMPESLLIDGHNPFKLLHKALSIGIHNQPDENCLKIGVIPASLQNLKKVCGGVFLGGAAGLTAQPISGV